MQIYFAVFLGGGIGSLLRFGFSRWITSHFQHINPVATLASNLLASIILAIWIYIILHKLNLAPYSKAFWVTGFCGGFSTFSTFSYETYELIRLGHTAYATANVLVSIMLAVFAIFALAKVQI